MSTEQIIQLSAAISSGLGVIIAFIVSFIKIFGTGKKLKALEKTFESAKTEWLKKETDYKNKIVELTTTINKQEIQLARFEDLIKQYQSKLIAYENRSEAKFINELEAKLANLKNAEINNDYKLLEVKKLLQLEKNNAEALSEELRLKDETITKLKGELDDYLSLKNNAEALTMLLNKKIIPTIKKQAPEVTNEAPKASKVEEDDSTATIII